MAQQTKDDNKVKKRKIVDLECEEIAVLEQEEHPKKRRKLHASGADTKNTNNANKSESPGVKPWSLWECENCGELEVYDMKGKFTIDRNDGDWIADFIDVCKLCYDTEQGLRPKLGDTNRNVENSWMSICCPRCMSGKACKLHDKIMIWQVVAMANPELNNESTTEEWQAALKKYKVEKFSDKEDDLYLECPYKEKDECRSLGGKWDPDKKRWYVPKGMDREPFSRWIPI